MSLDQAARGQRHARFRQLRSWLWAKKLWFAGGMAAMLMLVTAFVVWAVQDLPEPSQGFLDVGDVVVLDAIEV